MTSKLHLISIDPKDKIQFDGKLDTEISTVLRIKNETNTSQCLKIKCTNNQLFRIRPVISIVEAGMTVVVNLTYIPDGNKPASDFHHFAVYHIPAPEGCSALAVWREHYGPPQGQFRLKVNFEEKI